MTKGLEWNLRVTSIENLHILEKAQASFDYYWNSENFEPVEDEADIVRFNNAIYYENHKNLSTPIVNKQIALVPSIKARCFSNVIAANSP